MDIVDATILERSIPQMSTTKKIQKKVVRRRATIQYPRPYEMWVNAHGLSLFSREIILSAGGTASAPPIEFGPDARWADVFSLGFELLGEGRHLRGRYLNGECTDPCKPGSYVATMQNARDEADGMWKKRLKSNAVPRAGWKRNENRTGKKVLESLWTLSREEIMREIWNNLDDDEQARYPGLLVPVTEGVDTETEKWEAEPRYSAWAAGNVTGVLPPNPYSDENEAEPVEGTTDADPDADPDEVIEVSEVLPNSLEETLNTLLALRHGLMALEVSLRNE